jgi:predicted dienelactone hydrolase
MFAGFSFRKWLKRLIRILLILLLLIVIIIVSGVAFIEIRRHQALVLPAPTGPYAVGRMEYDWTDPSRMDPLAPRAGTKRELVVWAWYPAQRVSGAHPAPYLPQQWAQLSDQQHALFGLPIAQSSDSIQTHSIDRTPLIPGPARYPVLIFEPGLGLLPTLYTTLIEELASHGYVIFAITPTYSSDVVFPDGRVVKATPAGTLDTNENPQVASNQFVDLWSQDVIFVMNQLARLNTTPGSLWNQRLDLARLGVFGHSFGGATAAQVCHLDARCKAGINLDGDLAGDVVQAGLSRPFMMIQHDMGSCSNSECRSFQRDIHAILHTVPHDASYHISIQGTKHFNFTDYAVQFSPLHLLGLLGSIDGARGLQITRTYVLAFFAQYLNQTPSPLLRGPSRAYPEVQFFTP